VRCCQEVRPENAARSFRTPAPILRKPQVRRLLSDRPGARVLEVGAGCLRNARFLLRRGFRVSVLEVPNIETRFPREYEKFRAAGGAVHFTFPPSSTFDFVVATFVIETVCNRSGRHVLVRQIFDSLADHGCLITSVRGPADVVTAQATGVRCGDGYVTPNHTFVRSFSRAQLRSFLAGAGFQRLDFLHAPATVAPELLHAIAWKQQ